MATRVDITSSFWRRYRNLVRTEMIPFQWNVLNDQAGITIEKERIGDDGIPNEKSHAIENFKIAAGRTKGTHYGWTFQDSDVYKWLEAVAYSLREQRDPELEAKANEVIELIAEAQEPDGYLDTFYSILGIDYRYQSLAGSHELYCMGHFIEAAVAYHQATGNEQVLEVAKKCADNVDAHFGPEEGKIHGYDGHEEIEIGLLRLFHVTKEDRYLKLAKYFLMERGKHPDFFREQAAVYEGPDALGGLAQFPNSYFQNHKPIAEQETAEGHAVRVVYMCTALADLAATTGDPELFGICRRLWENITQKRMYITGGIGSTVIREAFTLDYDLPNDTMYCETCAAIGLIFFAKQMLRMDAKSEYAEVMERALYNCALAGMALDGKHFFYVNPLEVQPNKSKLDPTKSHVKALRPSWLGCACCPPNLARMLTSFDDYIYTETAQGIWLNQYVDSHARFTSAQRDTEITQQTNFPWDDTVTILVKNHTYSEDCVAIRIPSWADDYVLTVDGVPSQPPVKDGYVYVAIDGGNQVKMTLQFTVGIRKYYANPKVSEDLGKVAIGRGPLIYCLEGVDHDGEVSTLRLGEQPNFQYVMEEELLGGVGTITAAGQRVVSDATELYTTEKPCMEDVKLRFVPYYAWANRGENEMTVWIRE